MRIVKLDPQTRMRTVLADRFADAGIDSFAGAGFGDFAVERTGTILLMACSFTHCHNARKLYRLDPATGDVVLVSDLNNPAQGPGVSPYALELPPSGSPIFLSSSEGLVTVDAVTGTRALIFGTTTANDVIYLPARPTAGDLVVTSFPDTEPGGQPLLFVV